MADTIITSDNTPLTSGELRHRLNGGAAAERSASPTSVVGETQASLVVQENQDVVDNDNTGKQQSTSRHGSGPYREMTTVEKLFTSKEEVHVMHIHKILGFSCLASFVYRFANIGEKDGNFGPQIGTLVFILHHWLLNVSAFIFAIPQRRIRDGGFRIWPEYRFHSLVFASRALACMLLIWLEQRLQSTTPYHWMDLVIVLGTCAAADFGSSLQGEHRSNTVRGTTYTDPFGKWFASEMQFNLTACCLVGLRRYTMHLVAVAVIQLNSFLMTLRRKNVASHEILTAAYGVLLIGGLYVSIFEDDYSDMMLPIGVYGNLAVILRMGPLHMDKYVMWTLLGLSLHIIRSFELQEIVNTPFWMYSFFVTKIISTALGLHKRSKEMKQGQDARLVYVVLLSYTFLFGLILYNYFVVGWD